MTQTEKRASMQTLVNLWKESGLSQAKFAAQHNLALVKFRYLIQKLKPDNDDDSAFIQINGFGSQGIGLRYPNGVELLLPVQTPVGVLRSLIQYQAPCFPLDQPVIIIIGSQPAGASVLIGFMGWCQIV